MTVEPGKETPPPAAAPAAPAAPVALAEPPAEPGDQPATIADLEEMQEQTIATLEEMAGRILTAARAQGDERPKQDVLEEFAAQNPSFAGLAETLKKQGEQIAALVQDSQNRAALETQQVAGNQLLAEAEVLTKTYPGLTEADLKRCFDYIGHPEKNGQIATMLSLREVAGRVLGDSELEKRRTGGKSEGDLPPPPPAPPNARLVETTVPGGAPVETETRPSATVGLSQAVREIDWSKIVKWVP